MKPKIGYTCWFKHDDGRIVEGRYRGRNKVEQMTGFKRIEGGFEEEVTTYTVPARVTIHPGAAPKTTP